MSAINQVALNLKALCLEESKPILDKEQLQNIALMRICENYKIKLKKG